MELRRDCRFFIPPMYFDGMIPIRDNVIGFFYTIIPSTTESCRGDFFAMLHGKVKEGRASKNKVGTLLKQPRSFFEQHRMLLKQPRNVFQRKRKLFKFERKDGKF